VDYRGAEGESDDEYWERYPNDRAEAAVSSSSSAAGKAQDGDNSLDYQREYVSSFRALLEENCAFNVADCIMNLKSSRFTTGLGTTINRALAAGKTLKIYEDDKMKSTDFKATGAGSDKKTVADNQRAALEGLWARAGDAQRLHIVNVIVEPVRSSIGKAEGEKERAERSSATPITTSNQALLIHAWVDPELANLRLQAAQRVNNEEWQPNGVEECASVEDVHHFLDIGGYVVDGHAVPY
jgi:hypothetical protein